MSKIEVNQISSQCGSTLTIGQAGDTVTLACGATSSGFGATYNGAVNWDTTAKTTGFTAVSGTGYFVNSTSGAITVTLPASPSASNIVSVSDYNGSAGIYPITIARNGSNINGDASNYIITKSDSAVTFVYVDATVGWTSVQTSNIADNVSTFVVATGGTVTTCGNYKIHTFTGPGTFCVSNAGTACGSNTVDYLVIAGGAGGGSGYGAGGGGAGGYRESSGAASGCYSRSPLGACVSALPVTVQGYPVTVGAGGAGGTNPSPALLSSSPGSNSIFSSITSNGGGGAGYTSCGSPGPQAGGSGGGGTASSPSTGGAGNTPPVSPPQGNPGGTPATVGNHVGSGGGGASSAGTAGTNTGPGKGGDGGNGQPSSITGSAVTRAGGGGGGRESSCASLAGSGGTGGGGNAGTHPGGSGQAGTVNTGSGGGATGGVDPQPFPNGGAGGSGIVIIRYKYQ